MNRIINKDCYKKIKSNLINNGILLFALTPLLILFFLTFNIENTKWLLSRLIPIIFIACCFFDKNTIIENIRNPKLRFFYIFTTIIFIFYLITHLIRGDEFSAGRTLLTSVLYLACIPWKRISKNYFLILFAMAGIACGLNALYEFNQLNLMRVGIATNPVPYALFCATLSLINLNTLLIKGKKTTRTLAFFGMLLSLSALILTDVRGIILFYPLIAIYIITRIIPNKKKMFVILSLFIFFIASTSTFFYGDKIEARIKQTQQEYHKILSGNYNTSIGIRLSLWKQGINIPTDKVLFGLGKTQSLQAIKSINALGATTQPHYHNQYIEKYSLYGVIGLFIFLIWFMSFFVYLTKDKKYTFHFPILMSAIFFMFVAAGLTDVPFHHTHLVYFYSVVMAIIAIKDDEESEAVC